MVHPRDRLNGGLRYLFRYFRLSDLCIELRA